MRGHTAFGHIFYRSVHCNISCGKSPNNFFFGFDFSKLYKNFPVYYSLSLTKMIFPKHISLYQNVKENQ